MPFFGPSLAARSNSTTGTRTLTRWAAIWAPITPAPSTATLRTWNRFISVTPCASLDADPCLVAIEGADEAPDLERPATVLRRHAHLVDLAVVRVEDRAAVPVVLAVGLLHAFDDRHPQHRLVPARAVALVALGVLLRRIGDLLDL